jgi:hypothetical protein
MTPKEQAQEICEEMFYCFQGHLDEYTAKECAKIAVKLVLKEYWHHDTDREQYWQEVRNSIQKVKL